MNNTSLIGQSIYDLDTPCLLLDIDVLQANLDRIQAAANRACVGLRPHIKAHKTPQIALMQVRGGAIGVTASKISEAQAFGAAGIEDIFIANQLVGPTKVRALVALAGYVPRLSVAMDSLGVARPIAEAFVAAGRTLDVVLEVDAGAGRCGVPPEQLIGLARDIAGLKALRIRGLYAYAGGAPYGQRSREATAAWAAAEGRLLAQLGAELRVAGFCTEVISGGCTPTATLYEPGCGLTEIRPGTYALNDRNQIDLGACAEADIATTLLSTVVSRPRPDLAICDAGSKSIATQLGNVSAGFGWVYGHPEGIFTRLNDEHGYLDLGPMSWRPEVGDKLRIIPPRICTCLNLYDELAVISGERVVDVWRIAARGANR